MSGGNKNPFGAAYTADAVNVRAEANFKVFLHQVFSVSKRFSLPKSGAVDVIFDPTACTGLVTLLPIALIGAVGGPIFVDSYINPTFTLGDEYIGVDRFFIDPVIPKGKVIIDPTVSVVGTKLPFEFMIPSNGAAAVTKAGGQAREDLVIAVDCTNKYMFRFMNQDSVDDTTIQLSMTWFELPAFT